MRKQQLKGLSNKSSSIAKYEILPGNTMCFSHLRWEFVFQRPQHLLTRFSSLFNVFYVEEPLFDAEIGKEYIAFSSISTTLHVLVPHLPQGITGEEVDIKQRELLNGFLSGRDLNDFVFWYYTPMALSFTDHIKPAFTVYDCMDELTGFNDAPVQLIKREQALFRQADVVFTGGYSLYEVKKLEHHAVHLFPSSIQKEHFEIARFDGPVTADQASLKHPIIGFFGVLDERLDIDLIYSLAKSRPDWNFVLIGPVIKISDDAIPSLPNLHLLGKKSYNQLPTYLRSWDVALIPFVLNESTRYISPTKTPEYLAAGIPVVSTPIFDVVYTYGPNNLVHIEKKASGFARAIDEILAWSPAKYKAWLEVVDATLNSESWDNTFSKMLTRMWTAFLALENRRTTDTFLNQS